MVPVGLHSFWLRDTKSSIMILIQIMKQKPKRILRTPGPSLEKLGLVRSDADQNAIRFVNTAAEAVRNADFVQESVPERLKYQT